jgi:hypothetical protein
MAVTEVPARPAVPAVTPVRAVTAVRALSVRPPERQAVPAVRPVQAVRVSLAPASESRSLAGIVRPRHEADIGFRVGGRLIARCTRIKGYGLL